MRNLIKQFREIEITRDNNGADEWNRTTDLDFTKVLLYQLSYIGVSI